MLSDEILLAARGDLLQAVGDETEASSVGRRPGRSKAQQSQ
jgi:hypothetical protein